MAESFYDGTNGSASNACTCNVNCDCCNTCWLVRACGSCASCVQTTLRPCFGISIQAFHRLFAYFEMFLVCMDLACLIWGMRTKQDFPGYDANWALLDKRCTQAWHDGTFGNGLFVTYLNGFGCLFNAFLLAFHIGRPMSRTMYISAVVGSTFTTFAITGINWLIYYVLVADSGWNGCGKVPAALASSAFAYYVQFTRWQYIGKCPVFAFMSIMTLVNAREFPSSSSSTDAPSLVHGPIKERKKGDAIPKQSAVLEIRVMNDLSLIHI